MAHAQKPDSVFQRNGRVHLYRRGCQFSRVLAFLECGSGENDCSNTGWTVPSQTEDCLATHSIRLFPLHFSSRASPCSTRFRFHYTVIVHLYSYNVRIMDHIRFIFSCPLKIILMIIWNVFHANSRDLEESLNSDIR